MIYPRFQCIVTGHAFVPSRLSPPAQLIVEKSVDAAQPARLGRVVLSTAPDDSLEALVALIEQQAGALRQHGADEIEVYAAIRYEGQANWEISPDLLTRLGRMNAHLLMSFYEDAADKPLPAAAPR